MDISTEQHLSVAREIHQRTIVVDTHCDTTCYLGRDDWDISDLHSRGHVDIPRLREGGIDALFMAVYAPGPLEPGAGVAAARTQIEVIEQTIRRHHTDLVAARTAFDVRRAKNDGRIAVLTAIEGGYLIEDSLDILAEYRSLGAAYMTLTHSFHTNWADSSGVVEGLEPRHGGLTDFGRKVVGEMNRMGMMVDVSHVSDDTFWDVVRAASAPLVATHSCCRALSSHRRNLSDEMMKAIAATDGVVQINFAAAFLDPDFPPPDPAAVRAWGASGADANAPAIDHVTPLSLLVDHFDHALRVVGPRHVGIGSDFDGVAALPAGMEDCSKMPYLTAGLLGRGYGEADLTGLLGENILRVMEACAEAAVGGTGDV